MSNLKKQLLEKIQQSKPEDDGSSEVGVRVEFSDGEHFKRVMNDDSAWTGTNQTRGFLTI